MMDIRGASTPVSQGLAPRPGMVYLAPFLPVRARDTAHKIPHRWIVNPIVDLFFVCGGCLWILVTATILAPQLFNGNQAPVSSLLLLAGTFLFGDAHNAATIMRLCDEPQLRRKHKIVSFCAPMGLAILSALAISNPVVLVYCVKIYLLFISQHVSAQSYGIAMIYCGKAKLKLNKFEIMLMKTSFTSMTLTAVARNFSNNATAELFGVKVPVLVLFPESVAWIFYALAASITLLALILVLRRTQKCAAQIPIGAILTALTTLMVLTIGANFGMAGVYAPAFFHGSQYLAVTTSAHLKASAQCIETRTNQAPRVGKEWLTNKGVLYFVQAVLLGVVLYLALPLTISQLGCPVFTALAAVFCAVNFHHFLADSVIWRMKDPNTRKLLV